METAGIMCTNTMTIGGVNITLLYIMTSVSYRGDTCHPGKVSGHVFWSLDCAEMERKIPMSLANLALGLGH